MYIDDTELRDLADEIWAVAKELAPGSDQARRLKDINQRLYYKRRHSTPSDVASSPEYAAWLRDKREEFHSRQRLSSSITP